VPLIALLAGVVGGFAATGRLAELLSGGLGASVASAQEPPAKAPPGSPVAKGQPPQTPAPPGSPAATQSPRSLYLPFPTFPQKPFGGKIGLNAADSTPYWPAKVVPPTGAPNVLLIMTDDAGFGAPSTFGGVIPTPALDRVARAGLRYNKV